MFILTEMWFGVNVIQKNVKLFFMYQDILPFMYAIKLFWSGCHAQFGNYGRQDGDGIPGISGERQREITVRCILEWMNEGDIGFAVKMNKNLMMVHNIGILLSLCQG